ncbi:winged helix-turn-helix transcriptional regulator [Saccharolobus solfataricus]|uniref:TrmB family transcriptional regulator n=2 Tax=Saccharolobus solfataricus TaxID=2287 RepID=A0A0E3MG25_SACSO|nr:helix-turn-helix domain-containing protein [Saccharolobus solfataricus]AKA72703.1 winged helix-turn-helix transcriptional regulator [Saccharolobus solfataricus]AKA75402.1 winged helix-turn-helix transcriptional regulator [Saccharolobus solfataricus]AKA78094.1 winged helix-turn-helix transcriptional regulator [Saccharolobus solfataricus]AZF67217.1 winged helix-turn-helix transcriptional regulator [Saccharolobus solfataricus]AZF69837.1 winged helix-turn-helix transcriptional regulator [Saccha
MQGKSEISMPDGRVADVFNVVKFLYGLSDRDIEILKLLIKSQSSLTMEEISSELNITKSVVNKSILNLEKKNIVIKEKVESSKKGRRAYTYRVDVNYLTRKLVTDLDQLIKDLKVKIADVIGIQIEKTASV